ncbi:hypothetical protein [Herminiimonas contaminans]|uniref:Uncharacterized protein n=1 Tax=Herminiimonas contaminans TaxID=1111140 RepID=A0ABS0ESJ8_9BURK|nr:hypothetical protein [Herminiimonas contaminans]MBF8177819.1 hypothetical protein [Herminiimonas contaminans]
MTTREWWRLYYRYIRVAKREALKATNDVMFYGTGFVSIDADGSAKHIPLESMLVQPKPDLKKILHELFK